MFLGRIHAHGFGVLVHLVEPLGLEPLAEDLSDAGQVRHRLLVHRLSHEVAVLLRCRAHLDGGGKLLAGLRIEKKIVLVCFFIDRNAI